VRYAENASVVNLEEVQDKVVDLYAVWLGVGYSVRFDSNGGTGIMDNQTIAVGETQNLWPSAFARGGYNFAGWALSPTDAANGTVKYRDGAAVKNLATSNGAIVPLYAVWFSSDQTVRILFDANEGSVSLHSMPKAYVIEVCKFNRDRLFALCRLDGDRLCGVLKEDRIVIKEIVCKGKTCAALQLEGGGLAAQHAGGSEKEGLGLAFLTEGEVPILEASIVKRNVKAGVSARGKRENAAACVLGNIADL
jgi:hypothetical protein